MLHLSASNLHFLGDTDEEKRHDYCIHGHILFAIDDTALDSGDEWCVSASALRFMRSVFDNHFSGEEEHMIPCCGHFIIPAEDGKTVNISGCTNGVDFDVIHKDSCVIIKTENGKSFSIDFSKYKNAVICYAEEVEEFMRAAPTRIFEDTFHEKAFSAFKTEWCTLKERIYALGAVKQ